MQATTTLLQQRYEIVRPIAQSGMGAVYEGRDRQAEGTPVALKLCVFSTESTREVFEREANLLLGLSHPHLPRVRDLFSEGAGLYLVTDFVPGNDLEKTLQEFGQPLDHRTVLQWADQLLDALAYLHSLQPPIVHRDLKPANIKITPQGGVMLLDFGLAKGHTGNLNLYGYSSAYAPIEQVHNSGTDPRSDLYSLGATLFRLLTGQLPEKALARWEAIAATHHDPQRLADEIVPTIPAMVAQAIQRALSLDRETRFQTAEEMRESLKLALKTAPPLSDYSALEAEPENFSTFADQSGEAPSQHMPAAEPATFVPPPVINQPSVQLPYQSPAFVSPANAFASKATTTMTLPLPPANLAQSRSNWRYAAVFFAVLLIGGVGLGLLSQQFLGHSSAEPPNQVSQATGAPSPPIAEAAQFTNRFGMHFILVPAGAFTMGTTQEPDAQPPHIVTLAQPFYLSRHEITQQQWRALMRQNPSLHKGDALPVENITWFEVQKYLAQINLMNDGYRYRLPTEAEWEYAASAGQAEAGELESVAWFSANTQTPQAVGQKAPNAFGLYDMLGNVAEWCADAYHETYAGAPADGEAWTAATGSRLFRVMRGANWKSEETKVTAAARSYDEPQNRSGLVGFRLVAEKVAEPVTP